MQICKLCKEWYHKDCGEQLHEYCHVCDKTMGFASLIL